MAFSGLALGGDGRPEGSSPNVPIVERLRLERFAATAEGRGLLTYLISCALPDGVELHAEADGQRFSFRGAAGLAPDWLRRGLTPEEQGWVSACILARTNYFGKHVEISMRGGPEAPSALETTADEEREFSFEEGAFFGNIFLPEPVAYACTGQQAWQHDRDPVLTDRVCALPTDTLTAAGEILTACGFVHLGKCEAAERLARDVLGLDQMIYVYLKPRAVDR